MAFEIDAGDGPAIIPKSAGIDDTMSVDLSNHTRAERLHRQIIANIEATETRADIDAYWLAEQPILVEMARRWPGYYDRVLEQYHLNRAWRF